MNRVPYLQLTGAVMCASCYPPPQTRALATPKARRPRAAPMLRRHPISLLQYISIDKRAGLPLAKSRKDSGNLTQNGAINRLSERQIRP
jgi:hypothetical protein